MEKQKPNFKPKKKMELNKLDTIIFEKQKEKDILFYKLPHFIFTLFNESKISTAGFRIYILFFERIRLSFQNNYKNKNGELIIKRLRKRAIGKKIQVICY